MKNCNEKSIGFKFRKLVSSPAFARVEPLHPLRPFLISFQGDHNKLPQSGWLQTMHSCTVQESRNPESRYQLHQLLLEPWTENPTHASSWSLVVASNPWHSLFVGVIPVSSSVITWPVPFVSSVSLFSPLIRIPVIRFRAHLDPATVTSVLIRVLRRNRNRRICYKELANMIMETDQF